MSSDETRSLVHEGIDDLIRAAQCESGPNWSTVALIRKARTFLVEEYIPDHEQAVRAEANPVPTIDQQWFAPSEVVALIREAVDHIIGPGRPYKRIRRRRLEEWFKEKGLHHE